MKKEKTNQEILDSIDYMNNAASTTDCTGLMPRPPLNDYEKKSYEEIFSYGTPPVDAKKNVPKS